MEVKRAQVACLKSDLKKAVGTEHTTQISRPQSTAPSSSFEKKKEQPLHLSWSQGRPPEPEAGAQADEVGSAGLPVAWCAQAEESVVLHCTLPQVLAGAGAVQPEHKGVLLLTSLRQQAKVLVGASIL